jgi:uncharacterized membrane protein YhhN
MYVWFTLAFIFASLEVLAVSKNLQRWEYVAKPVVMVCLFIWLFVSTGLQGNTLWFGLGILSSLVGDVLLTVSSDRMFLLGLIAFLFAHIAYIAGFTDSLGTLSTWSLLLLVLIVVSVIRLIQRIVGAMRAKGEKKLIYPIIVYGSVISLMLYAAMSTIYDLTWKTSAAFFVSLGAFLFWTSDLILAWNKFVSPIKNGRIFNIVTYYFGQIGLIAGVIIQFR